MVDLSNLFTQITAPFNANSSIKVPETSFAASKENLTFANYRNLNNDDDKYVNDEQPKKMQEILDKKDEIEIHFFEFKSSNPLENFWKRNLVTNEIVFYT